MGSAPIIVLGLTAFTCTATWLFPLERADTTAPASAGLPTEGAEERRPVLLVPERPQKAPPAPAAPLPDRVKTIEEAVDEGVVKEPPPDPVERGSSRLLLLVNAEETGEPVSADVELWRLGAPGNRDWQAGDQLQAQGKIEAGSAQFDSLPEGTYRISSKDVRKGGEDPTSFSVGGRLTEVSLHLPMPRKFEVHLRVLDLYGRSVREGKRRPGSVGRYSHGPYAPDWVVPRSLRYGEHGWPSTGWGSARGCGYGGASTSIAAHASGFFWGTYAEASRTASASSSHELEVEGANRVSLRVTSEPARDRTFLAVAVPIDLLVAGVTLPSGWALSPTDAKIEATCKAVLLEDTSPPDLWRDLPIEVKVLLPDHEPLEFVARTGNPSPKLTLRRMQVASVEVR